MAIQRRSSGRSWQARWVAVLAVAALALVAACGGADEPSRARKSASPTAEPTAPAETAAVLRVVQRQFPEYVAGSGSGALMVEYEGADGCLLRKVDADGHTSSGAAPVCGPVRGTRTGFVMVDPMDVNVVYDVTYPWAWTKTKADLADSRDPARGDTYLGPCRSLVEGEFPDSVDVPSTGCLWDESGHAMVATDLVLAVDAQGRAWVDGAGDSVVRKGAEPSGTPPQLPFRVGQVLVGAGSTVVAWSADYSTDVAISYDAAASWQRLTDAMVPQLARDPDSVVVIGDRALMGPHGSRFWRIDDPAAQALVAHPAGPLTRVYAAGDLLWGMAAESVDPALRRKLWVSRDLGDTWAQVLDGATAAPKAAVPATGLAGTDSAQVEALIRQLDPYSLALDGHGNLMVVYQNANGRKQAWQLRNPKDKVVASGMGGYEVVAADRGFFVTMDGGNQYVDPSGLLTPVDELGSREPVQAGDVFVADNSVVFRASGPSLFTGAAEPNGTVTGQTSDGVMWALGRKTGDRTVVRWATPGGFWKSRDLGPRIGADRVYASGTIVLVPGRSQLYASNDSGRTWWSARHQAANYAGGAPGFEILPDGSATGGDYRGGVSRSSDLHTFTTPTDGEDWVPVIGSLFVRDRPGPGVDVSLDRVHWEAFAPQTVRRLLAEQAAMRVHG